MLSNDDLHWFHEGTHFQLYDKLGAHPSTEGVSFNVWAPNAESVSVIGDFNGWNRQSHLMKPKGSLGVWHLDVPKLEKGAVYKYFIKSRLHGYQVEKADPFARYAEVSPKTASVV